MDDNCNHNLVNRCRASKGTSAQHIYACARLPMQKYLPKIPLVLDLGSGTGQFKKYINQTLTCQMDETDYLFEDGREDYYSKNLNDDFELAKKYDAVTIIEVLHFMENPRHLLRQAHRHLKSQGLLIVTIPNLHSLTSIISFLLRGCHSAFWGNNYPSHITPIHKIDLERMLVEQHFTIMETNACNLGRVPGTKCYWQRLMPFGNFFFNSSLFSDNIIVTARRD